VTATVMSVARPAPGSREKLAMLRAGGEPDGSMAPSLAEIAELPFVESVLALPDLHQKARSETPSSLAITTRGAIVPEFTSVAVNDGMGVVMTDLEAREMSPRWVERFFSRINSNSAAHLLDVNRYSLSADELGRAVLEGGRAGVERYGLDPGTLERVEGGGSIPVPHGAELWRSVASHPLLSSRLCRSEMGLNFGGNHFLEVQAVDRVLDAGTAARWGVASGRVAVMYHLGPGPFGATLLHHFSRRRELSRARAPLFLLSKLLLHYGRRDRSGSALRKWSLHFRNNGWSVYAPESEEGLLLRQALAAAGNFGFAYRLATVAAIRDALRETVTPRVQARLLWDVSHNGIVEEPWGERTAWVARHNACRRGRGEPAIVAGSHDVPSYLGVGALRGPMELHSYDHGAGHLIETWRRRGRLKPAGGRASRIRMTRGRGGRVVRREETPLCSSEVVDRLMECLGEHQVIHPVVRLRPLGTLKN